MGTPSLLLALAEHSTGHGEGWEKTQLFPAQTRITPPAVTCVPSLPSIPSSHPSTHPSHPNPLHPPQHLGGGETFPTA